LSSDEKKPLLRKLADKTSFFKEFLEDSEKIAEMPGFE